MLWLKAFHVVFVVAWFTGLFALPRLFVYHAKATDPASKELLKLMERRMFGMMTFGSVMAMTLGVAMLVTAPAYLELKWMHAKLTFVLLLIAYHIACHRLMVAFREDRNRRSHVWLRVFNELPLVPLIAIVVFVIVKPF
jgi:protoporphyrinogen IX oxidase